MWADLALKNLSLAVICSPYKAAKICANDLQALFGGLTQTN
jgi:hypothetical protein